MLYEFAQDVEDLEVGVFDLVLASTPQGQVHEEGTSVLNAVVGDFGLVGVLKHARHPLYHVQLDHYVLWLLPERELLQSTKCT